MSRAAEIFQSPSFWTAVLGFVLILAMGTFALRWARRWSAEMRAGGTDAEHPLEQYRQLRAQGELSDEEFEQIRRSLGPEKEQGPNADGK